MQNVGFTDIATTLGVRGLIRRRLVEEFEDSDYNGHEFIGYRATDAGLDWLETNEEKLVLRKAPPQPVEPPDGVDDLPF